MEPHHDQFGPLPAPFAATHRINPGRGAYHRRERPLLALQASARMFFHAEEYDGASLLKEHMLLADRWPWLYYLTALAAAPAVVVVWKRPAKLVTHEKTLI